MSVGLEEGKLVEVGRPGRPAAVEAGDTALLVVLAALVLLAAAAAGRRIPRGFSV